MKISSALLLLAFSLFAPLAGATQGEPAPAKPSQEELRRNVEHWKTLPQTEKDRIKQSYRRFQSMRQEQASVVQDNFSKFRNLPAERRRELSKKWKDLTPQDRERFAQPLRDLQNMDADRRNMAMKFARMAHSLTPEQKRQLMQLSTPEEKKQYLTRSFREQLVGDFLRDKSLADRSAFEALPRPEQKRQLQQHFRGRGMRGPPGERGGSK